MTCVKPEDPAAVAARESRNRKFAYVFGGSIVGFGLFAFVRWIKDTTEVLGETRERKPWDF